MNISEENLYERIAERANQDVLPGRDGLHMLYYITNTENSSSAHSASQFLKFGVEFVLMLPMLALMSTPWVIAVRQAKNCINRIRYVMPLMAQLLVVPVFFMATDYSRWWVCWTFGLSMIPLVAYTTGDKGFRQATQTLWGYFKKYWYLPLLLGVYMLQLHISNRYFFEGMKESAELIESIGLSLTN